MIPGLSCSVPGGPAGAAELGPPLFNGLNGMKKVMDCTGGGREGPAAGGDSVEPEGAGGERGGVDMLTRYCKADGQSRYDDAWECKKRMMYRYYRDLMTNQMIKGNGTTDDKGWVGENARTRPHHPNRLPLKDKA